MSGNVDQPYSPMAEDSIGSSLEETEVFDANRALDLAQQGFGATEIADLLDSEVRLVERELEDLVPGGVTRIRASLRHRLRAWGRENSQSTWLDAEVAFGIPHTHIVRLVRAPQQNEVLRAEPSDAGFLDLVLTGFECRDQRAVICARAYAMGATLQELGGRFGVTRERIRQILGKETPWSSTDISNALRGLRAARLAEHERAALAWSTAHPGAPVSKGVAALGMSEQQVLERLGRRRSRHQPAGRKKTSSTRRSDDQILSDLRAYHLETGKTTAAGFTDWARDNEVPGPQTAAIRFGTWNDALRAADLAQAMGNKRSNITDEDMWAALVSLVQAPDGGTTAVVAEEWLAAREGAPSLALIRQRLGMSWSEIVARALAAVNDDPSLDFAWVQRVKAPRDWNAIREQGDPIESVRDAIAHCGPRITTAKYGEWAQVNGRPGAATVQRRAGMTWPQLVTAAGGTPNRSKVKGRTVEECRQFVADFLAESPRGGATDYGQWAKENGGPSRSTITDRFGSWEEAVEASRP